MRVSTMTPLSHEPCWTPGLGLVFLGGVGAHECPLCERWPLAPWEYLGSLAGD